MGARQRKQHDYRQCWQLGITEPKDSTLEKYMIEHTEEDKSDYSKLVGIIFILMIRTYIYTYEDM